MSEFKIGGKVLCVKNHSARAVRRGQVFTVKACGHYQCSCRMGTNCIDVGLNRSQAPSQHPYLRCPACGNVFKNDGIFWLSVRLFIPLDDLQTELSTTTVEEFLNEAVEV